MSDENSMLLLISAAAVGIVTLLEQDTTAMEDIIISDLVIPSIEQSQSCRNSSRLRRLRTRRSWAIFMDDLSDKQFRRYFRMSKDLFNILCRRIEEIVGVHKFMSEDHLNEIMSSPHVDRSMNIYFAHAKSTGGVLPGEVKLASTLRILGGGTYMDMGMLFDTSFNHMHKVFKYVIVNWLSHKSFYNINGIEYCSDENRMQEVALQFSQSSLGVMNGCIGALDGWVVKIKKPTRSDGVNNPKSFYSRKGYFAVNVQAIVDKKKRVLFRSITSRGAEHDSTAFKNSKLYKWLLQNWKSLVDKGYHFIGDSAYALKSFLLTPYDNALHGTAEDNYNFFHSSSRISVECAFGEIDLRWGILWKELEFSLALNCKIIDVCMRMHNFIVEYRNDTNVMDGVDREVFDEECRRFYAVNPRIPEGTYGGEDDLRRDDNGNLLRGGRPTTAERNSSDWGKTWRNMIRDEISRQRLVRPPTNYYRERNRLFEDY